MPRNAKEAFLEFLNSTNLDANKSVWMGIKSVIDKINKNAAA